MQNVLLARLLTCLVTKKAATLRQHVPRPRPAGAPPVRRGHAARSDLLHAAPRRVLRHPPSYITSMAMSSASILKISDEKTLQLIDLYRNEQCLWNTNILDYKSKEKRSIAAAKIATILDLPNFTAKHVMMKFKNLRNSYSQEIKKIAQSVAAGQDIYVPRVFWFEMMDTFLKPHLQGRLAKDEVSVYRNDASEDWLQVDGAEQLLNPDTMSEARSSEDENHSKRRKPNPTKRSRPGTVEKSLAQTLKDIQSHLHVLTSHNDDYHDTFGKYVASLLRSLPPQKALALQPKIVSLITGAEVEYVLEDAC